MHVVRHSETLVRNVEESAVVLRVYVTEVIVPTALGGFQSRELREARSHRLAVVHAPPVAGGGGQPPIVTEKKTVVTIDVTV